MRATNNDMRELFNRLTDENKDILLQIARDVQSTRQVDRQPSEEQANSANAALRWEVSY